MARSKASIDLERAEELAADGLTFKQIACSLGVSERTVYNRLRIDDAFCAAVHRGRASLVQEVTQKLKEQALEKGNVQALIFLLKSVGGISETLKDEENRDYFNTQYAVKEEELGI